MTLTENTLHVLVLSNFEVDTDFVTCHLKEKRYFRLTISYSINELIWNLRTRHVDIVMIDRRFPKDEIDVLEKYINKMMEDTPVHSFG